MKDAELVNKYDKTKMCEIYDMWPDIAKKTFESKLEPIKIDVNKLIRLLFMKIQKFLSIKELIINKVGTNKRRIEGTK